MMKHKKKKIETSKLMAGVVILSFGIYGIWCGIKYYSLAKLAIENNTVMPDPILAVTCVTTVIAALLSYCLYNGFLKNSLNKYGLTKDEESGIIKSLVNNDSTDEIISKVMDALLDKNDTSISFDCNEENN